MFHAKPSKPLQSQATIAGWTVLTSDPKLVPADFSRAAAGAAHAPGGDDDGDDWDDDDGQPTPGPRTGDGSAKRTGDVPVDGSGDGSVSGDSDAAKLVELCDDVVQQYARGERNKLDSIQLLCATLDEHDASDALDAWLDKLQRADASKRRAARAGAGDAPSPLRSSARGTRVEERVHRQHEPRSAPAATAGADRRARFAPADDGDDSDSSASSDASDGHGRALEGSQRPRATLDLHKTPFGRQNIAAQPVSAHVLKTIELRVNYGHDLKYAKACIASDPNAPPFPQDQWEVVLRDGVVDFNKLLSARFPSEVQELATHHIGGVDGPAIVFGSRSKRSVQSRTDWSECWDMYESFVTYLFGHRAAELRRYKTHVLGLFSSRAVEYHGAVIQADIAMRSEVALRNDLALDDFHELIFVWQRFVDARGAHAADTTTSPSAASSSRKTRRGESSREFCKNWNKGRCNFKACRHVHACSICNTRSHTAADHPAEPTSSSSSAAPAGGTVDAASRPSRRA